MQKIINQLIQVQELTIAKDQQEASQTDAHLDSLNKNIASMLDALPEDVAAHFVKLQKRDGLAIVPISERVCSGCAMALPASFVQTVRQAKELKSCTNCARLVYVSDRVIRRKPQVTGRYTVSKVGIERFSASTLMIPRLEATTPEDVLKECAQHLKDSDFIENSEMLVEEALKREAIASTAVSYGLAFPHVRGVEGGGLSMVAAMSPEGVDFGNPDGEKSHLIFFITIPSAASSFYLTLLSGLTKTFHKKESREKLLACDTEMKMWKRMLQLTKKTIP